MREASGRLEHLCRSECSAHPRGPHRAARRAWWRRDGSACRVRRARDDGVWRGGPSGVYGSTATHSPGHACAPERVPGTRTCILPPAHYQSELPGNRCEGRTDVGICFALIGDLDAGTYVPRGWRRTRAA